jgi:hypothetical protein
MYLKSLTFANGGCCELTFQKPQRWLRATWSGFITTQDALRGGHNYLQQAGPLHCLYLLNNNAALQGPWFDSLNWLKSVWLPQAQRMGLRYVAHVVQADTHSDILTLHHLAPLLQELELQIFEDVAKAEDWLRSCQLPQGAVNQGPFDQIPMRSE